MAETLIAEGVMWDLTSLGIYEDQFAEGDRGILDLHLSITPSDFIVSTLEAAIRGAGVILEGIDVIPGDSSHMRIRFQKGVAPLAIVAIAVAAVILIFGAIMSWKLFQVSPTTITWQIVLIIVLAIVAASVVTVLIARTGRVKAGKVIVGR